MPEREPDWDATYRCSDPPEESCSDAACPVHTEDDDADWGDAAEREYVRQHGDDDLDTGHTRDPKGDEAAHG